MFYYTYTSLDAPPPPPPLPHMKQAFADGAIVFQYE
jgi:hypothetical protein